MIDDGAREFFDERNYRASQTTVRARKLLFPKILFVGMPGFACRGVRHRSTTVGVAWKPLDGCSISRFASPGSVQTSKKHPYHSRSSIHRYLDPLLCREDPSLFPDAAGAGRSVRDAGSESVRTTWAPGRAGLCGTGGERFFTHSKVSCQCGWYVAVHRIDRRTLRVGAKQMEG